MKAHAALVSVAVTFALSGFAAGASTPNSNCVAGRKISDLATEASKATPRALAVLDSATARHRFPVMDEKGLLLSCVAPELETNSETDVFKYCALAPGRTLDDVMHTFIQGIHEEQRLHAKEPAKDSDDSADGKSARK